MVGVQEVTLDRAAPECVRRIREFTKLGRVAPFLASGKQWDWLDFRRHSSDKLSHSQTLDGLELSKVI